MSLRQGLGGGGSEGSGVSLAPSPDRGCWGRAGWALEVKGNSQAQSSALGRVSPCVRHKTNKGWSLHGVWCWARACACCGPYSGAVPTLQ